jgi:hypothetical protein
MSVLAEPRIEDLREKLMPVSGLAISVVDMTALRDRFGKTKGNRAREFPRQAL